MLQEILPHWWIDLDLLSYFNSFEKTADGRFGVYGLHGSSVEHHIANEQAADALESKIAERYPQGKLEELEPLIVSPGLCQCDVETQCSHPLNRTKCGSCGHDL